MPDGPSCPVPTFRLKASAPPASRPQHTPKPVEFPFDAKDVKVQLKDLKAQLKKEIKAAARALYKASEPLPPKE